MNIAKSEDQGKYQFSDNPASCDLLAVALFDVPCALVTIAFIFLRFLEGERLMSNRKIRGPCNGVIGALIEVMLNWLLNILRGDAETTNSLGNGSSFTGVIF